ncbi:MAG: hypothetical protein J6W37_06675 [Bacteroidales bacterium]|nr:hypothetical protein [Bacteroidales bacterium]
MREIEENEIRVIGSDSPQSKKWLLPLLCAVAIGIIILVVMLVKPNGTSEQISTEEPTIFEPQDEICTPKAQHKFSKYTGNESFIEKLDTIINDVSLSIFIPHNLIPSLCVGQPSKQDSSLMMCAQAADIRADNKKIVGAFVLKGKPIAWGLSKHGYCAIINDTVIVGRSENSPLFEMATEKQGYFFRQYALVDSCRLVENNLKNKALRKALCQRCGETFIATSANDESMHDFSLALVDLGVENAIALDGGKFSFGWYVSNNTTIDFNEPLKRTIYPNETYIVWRKNQ